MAKLEFGRLRDAWKGEASDFTPLLNEQLDSLGAAIGVDLLSVGKAEVPAEGGRRIDIVAQGADGAELVIENQYATADHDHLTRGLAYAVARGARGLIVVAEGHRDEFLAVAEYLNAVAENDRERGIAVWLVEARAVSIEGSAWAPLFTVVAKPNSFRQVIAEERPSLPTADEFWEQFHDPGMRGAAQRVVSQWLHSGNRHRFGPNHVVLEAKGPSVNGYRTVIAVYSDGRVMVPFNAYGGTNSGIPVAPLTTPTFRAEADGLFDFKGSERIARTSPRWLTTERVEQLLAFSNKVAAAYAEALGETADV